MCLFIYLFYKLVAIENKAKLRVWKTNMEYFNTRLFLEHIKRPRSFIEFFFTNLSQLTFFQLFSKVLVLLTSTKCHFKR